MPRSARWGDGEYLTARNHEVIRMARMLDLGKSCLEGGLEDGSRVVGAQLKPGTQPRLLIIGCIVGELDAEVSATGKADNEHRLIDAWKLNGPHRAPQDRFKALSQFPAPVRTHEDMHIAAKSDHDVADPFLPILEPSAEQCSPAVTSSHKARSRRPVMPHRARVLVCRWVFASIVMSTSLPKAWSTRQCRFSSTMRPSRDARIGPARRPSRRPHLVSGSGLPTRSSCPSSHGNLRRSSGRPVSRTAASIRDRPDPCSPGSYRFI